MASVPAAIVTGLPSSGKTTLGGTVVARLTALGLAAQLLDGDELRARLPPDLGFSRTDRLRQAERARYLAELLQGHGVIVVLALVLPYRESRAALRTALGPACIEVHLDPPIAACVARDTRGVYRRTREDGDAGYDRIVDPYEPPLAPDVIVDTATTTLGATADQVLARLLPAAGASPYAAPAWAR